MAGSDDSPLKISPSALTWVADAVRSELPLNARLRRDPTDGGERGQHGPAERDGPAELDGPAKRFSAADLRSSATGARPRIGDYTLLSEIGRGGMGVVYEAWQESLGRQVALKILPLAGRMDERQIHRFRNEARAAAQLTHPNIVPVYAVGEENGVHYYAMQYISGQDLAKIIGLTRSLVESKNARPSGDTPHAEGPTLPQLPDVSNQAKTLSLEGASHSSTWLFPSPEYIDLLTTQSPSRKSEAAARGIFESVVQIGIQAAEALFHAHQLGVVHRDIKPSNLMLDENGNVWITDFGLAQVQGAAAVTLTGEVIGTLRYMSPEQPLGQRVLVDQRTDIYSLGVTLYELLTLKKAFGGETPREIIRQVCFDDPTPIRKLNPQVPEELETIVIKAMSRNPEDRYQTAQEMADDLRRFRHDQPIVARKPDVLQRVRRWIRRHVALVTTAAVSMAVVCVSSLTAAAVIWNSLSAETQQRRRAESLLDKSEGLRLTANSALQQDVNPGLSLLLAIRGSELNPGVDANAALLGALATNHEQQTFSPRPEITHKIALSPDGRRVVTTVSEHFHGKGSFPAIETSLRNGQNLRTFDDGTAITSAAYSPDGRLLLTTSSPLVKAGASEAEGAATASVPSLWTAQNGTRMFSLNDARLTKVLGTEFSRSSDRIVVPGRDNSVRVYSTEDGRQLISLIGHTDIVHAAAFSPDDRRIVSVSADQTVRVWDLSAGAQIAQISVENRSAGEVTALFAGDADRLVISSRAGTQLVSVATGSRINPQHWKETASVVTRDGRFAILFRLSGRHVVIRNTHTFQRTAEFDVEDFIRSVAVSEDGRRLLVIRSLSASVHRMDDGREIAALKGHTQELASGAINADGRHAVTAAFDGTVRYWHVENGDQLMTLASRPARMEPSTWALSGDSSLAAVATKPAFHTELRDANGQVVSQRISGRVSRAGSRADHVVTTDEDEVIVWHVPTARRIASYTFQTGQDHRATEVPGTDFILIVDQGRAVLWNTTSGERFTVGDPDTLVADSAVHPANGQIALAQDNGICLTIDSQTRQIVNSFTHEQKLLFISFSPTGSRLVTIDNLSVARLWPADGQVPLQTMQHAESKIDRAAFSADETAILGWSDLQPDRLWCWRTADGQLVNRTKVLSFPTLAMANSQPVVAIGSTTDGLVLWNWETAEERRVSEAPVHSPVFLEGRLLSVEATPGFRAGPTPVRAAGPRPDFSRSALVIRDATTGAELSRQSLTVDPWKLTADPITGHCVFSFQTYDVAILRMDDHQTLATIGAHAAPVVFRSFVGKPEKIVCASMDGTISLWDVSGQQLNRMRDHQHSVVNAAVSPDGLRLATFDDSGTGILWNLNDGTKILELPKRAAPVRIAKFSASGKSLLTNSGDRAIGILDLIARSEKSWTFEPGIRSAEWAPDDQRLLIVTGSSEAASASSPGPPPRALLVDLTTSAETPLAADGIPVLARFRPDGRQVAIVSADGQATLCQATTGEAIREFNPNRRPIFDVAFSPDNRDLLVLHDDELSLWDLQGRDEILRLPNRNRLRFAAGSLSTHAEWNPFSPDGRWILSATTRLHKWPRDPLQEALRQAPRPLTEVERKRFAVDLAAIVAEQ